MQFVIDINLDKRLNKSVDQLVYDLTSLHPRNKIKRFLSDKEKTQLTYLADNLRASVEVLIQEKMEQEKNEQSNREFITA